MTSKGRRRTVWRSTSVFGKNLHKLAYSGVSIGQEGSEHEPGNPQISSMVGGPGDDELFGGPGEDGLDGQEDADEHYGGMNNDFIDAAAREEPGAGATDAPDLVDCGSGFDTTLVLPNDRVRDNCEEVIDVSETTSVAPPSHGTTDEEQQRQREFFLETRGG